LSWIALFAIFSSFTALSRYTATFYLIVMAVPLFAWFLFKHWRQSRSLSNAIVKPLLLAAVFASPGIWFLVKNFAQTREYYSKFGYAFNAPLEKSLFWTLTAIQNYIGTPICVALLAVLLLSIFAVCTRKEWRAHVESFLCACWCPLSVLIFLVLIVKATDGVHPTLYMVPALFICAFYAVTWNLKQGRALIASILLLLTAFAAGSNAYNLNAKMAGTPAPQAYFTKLSQLSIAKYLAHAKARTFAEFDDENPILTLEAFYMDHSYPFQPNGYFTEHEFYWKGLYPHLSTADELADHVYKRMGLWIDVAIVPDNPGDVEKNPMISQNPFSLTVARTVAQRIKSDPA
ncbi:MAG: hypothetical protein ACRD3W_01255, partial [Terriglobales bacterium]